MPTIDEKKAQLEAAYRRNELLENQCQRLDDILKKLKSASDEAEDYADTYGDENVERDEPLHLFSKLDDLRYDTKKEAEALGKVWEAHEIAMHGLEAEEDVICRCCGEVRCDTPEIAKTAPTMTLVLEGVKDRPSGEGTHNIYRASFVYGEYTGSATGSNGVIGQAAEMFWWNHGFEKHGAYHYTLALERRLKKTLAKAPSGA